MFSDMGERDYDIKDNAQYEGQQTGKRFGKRRRGMMPAEERTPQVFRAESNYHTPWSYWQAKPTRHQLRTNIHVPQAGYMRYGSMKLPSGRVTELSPEDVNEKDFVALPSGNMAAIGHILAAETPEEVPVVRMSDRPSVGRAAVNFLVSAAGILLGGVLFSLSTRILPIKLATKK